MTHPVTVANACRVEEWARARTLLGNDLPGWIFRGQGRTEWGLTPTLERNFGERPVGVTLQQTERALLDLFQRSAWSYVDHPPRSDDYIEWLAMMQHFGAPTRLLDFTRSFYVALYFAFEEPHDGDRVIWAVNPLVIRGLLNESMRSSERLAVDPLGGAFFNTLFSRSAQIVGNAVLHVEPFQLNERIQIQQGLFVAALSLEKSFEENLFGMFGLTPREIHDHLARGYSLPEGAGMDRLRKSPIIKVIISGSLRAEILADLQRMNITAATLYPGLEGFSRSLRHFNIDRIAAGDDN